MKDIVERLDGLERSLIHAKTARARYRAYRRMVRFIDNSVFHLTDIRTHIVAAHSQYPRPFTRCPFAID